MNCDYHAHSIVYSFNLLQRKKLVAIEYFILLIDGYPKLYIKKIAFIHSSLSAPPIMVNSSLIYSPSWNSQLITLS